LTFFWLNPKIPKTPIDNKIITEGSGTLVAPVTVTFPLWIVSNNNGEKLSPVISMKEKFSADEPVPTVLKANVASVNESPWNNCKSKSN